MAEERRKPQDRVERAEQEEPPRGIKGFMQKVKQVTYGVAAHDMTRYALRTRASIEHLFILVTMGDMLGVPILPPHYSMRLLAYVVPEVATWTRRRLREQDVTEPM